MLYYSHKEVSKEREKEEVKVKKVLRKVDHVIDRGAFYLSWISVACIVVMGILAVVDVILSKAAGSGIAVQKEIIEECMIPVFILFVANIQMTEGLMTVDIISKHYGPIGKKISQTITCVLGTAIMSYAGSRVFVLFQDYLRKQTRATNMMNSIKVWPFALCLSIGLFTLAFAYFWTIIRVYLIPEALDSREMTRPDEAAELPKREEGGEG